MNNVIYPAEQRALLGRTLSCFGVTLLAAMALMTVASPANAVPRMSLTAGTPCIACHVNPTGSGMRTELGYGSMSDVGALTFTDMGLKEEGDPGTNTLFDGILALGVDARVQMARLGNPTLDETGDDPEVIYPEYTIFPMQLQPYVAVRPMTGLTLYGSFVAGPETLRGGDFCDTVFPGMSCYDAFALYEPTGAWPTVRAGVFQPAIGIRHDDHTLFVRGDARDRRRPIIPPSYAEPGAEITIQPVTWFRTEVGGYATMNLDEALNDASDTADLWPAAYNVRVTFQPYIKIPIEGESEDDGFGDDDFGDDDFGDDDFGDFGGGEEFVINSWFGGSAYGSGDFLMLNGFAGLGIHEGLALVAEVSSSRRTLMYDTFNQWLGLWYTPIDWFTAGARVERARTTTANDEDVAWSYVGSVEFFPIPSVEIRPEYRLVDTEDYLFGQATVQLHLFY